MPLDLPHAPSASGPVLIHGAVHPKFGEVAEAFRANFAHRGEIGAALTIDVEGQRVVDVWGGLADRATGRPWERDTRGVMFSATKGLVALAFLMLEDRGILDVDAPVVTWWPGFGRHGKQHITVRTLLNHRAGLSVVDLPVPLTDYADPPRVDEALEAQAPVWQPGTAQGYGGTAWGMYTGALFRRITGETVGAFLKREVFEPLGVDVRLGLPPSEGTDIATLYPAEPKKILPAVLPRMVLQDSLEGRFFTQVLLKRRSIPARAFANPQLGPRRLDVLNDPEVRSWELPWKGAVGSARGLATIYAALAQGGALDGVRLVSEAALARVHPRQSWAWEDRVLLKPMGFSQGFMKEEPHLFSPNEAAFGHSGAGGALGMADPTHRIAVGYVMNGMDWHVRSPRTLAITHALYRALGYG